MAEPTLPNPFESRFESLNRRKSQKLILVCVFGFVTVVSIGTMVMAARTETLLSWLVFRIVIGELLVAWLAADHITATLKRAREDGEWDEWRLIPDAPREMARALMKSTHRMIWVGLGLWAVVELGYVLWAVATGGALGFELVILSLVFALHATSAMIAAACFLTESAKSPASIIKAWCNGFIKFIFETFVQFVIFYLLLLGVVAILKMYIGGDLYEAGLLIILVILAYVRNMIIRVESITAEKAVVAALQAE